MAAAIAAVCLVSLYACVWLDEGEYVPAADEIVLKIELDVDEDVGLVLIDYEVGGVKRSGGMSNADRSMLKAGDTLYDTLSKDGELGGLDELGPMTVEISVVTEYVEPSFEDDYPEELVRPCEPVEIDAAYGGVYDIVVTGNNTDGYAASVS
jgi:hypothetical protein